MPLAGLVIFVSHLCAPEVRESVTATPEDVAFVPHSLVWPNSEFSRRGKEAFRFFVIETRTFLTSLEDKSHTQRV